MVDRFHVSVLHLIDILRDKENSEFSVRFISFRKTGSDPRCGSSAGCVDLLFLCLVILRPLSHHPFCCQVLAILLPQETKRAS